jgi:O-glycosyl hydrolase
MRSIARLISAACAAGLVAYAPACTSADSNPTAPVGDAALLMHHPDATASAATISSTAAVSGSAGQLIKGWGIYPGGGTGVFWNKAAIENAVYALGVTFIRERVDPALYVSGTTIPNTVINMSLLAAYVAKIKSAQAHGVPNYIMSVWTPPPSMKTNNSPAAWIDANNNGVVDAGEVGYLRTDKEAAFVAFLTKVMLQIKAQGLALPAALSIQNEPEHAGKFDGCIYTPAEWQKIIQDVRGAFDYNGLSSIKLFGPENGTYGGSIWSNYITDTPGFLGGPTFQALDTAGIDRAVGAYAHHMYGECNIWQMASAMQSHPKDAWLTEFAEINNNSELNKTIDMMRALGAAMVIVPHNYWAWWNGYATSSGAPDGQSLLGGTTTPIYTKRYWALKKLFTSVRPGWTVRTMTTSDPGLQIGGGTQDQCAARIDLVAFMNGSWSETVVLITNTSTNTRLITVTGMRGTTVTPYLTNAWNDMQPENTSTITRGAATITVPAQSVVLAVTK